MTSSRHPVFFRAIVLLLATWAAPCVTGAETARPPNILLILSDDQGYGDVGFNGGREIPTPHLDSIAANGVRFTQGYVTAPQCAPSRAGLLSGIDQNRFARPTNKEIDQFGIPSEIRSIGDYLQDAGYRTALIGKWHQGLMEGNHPLDRGFDRFFGVLRGSTFFFPPEGTDRIPGIFDDRKEVAVSEYLTFVLGDKAIDFIQAEPDRPFFLFLSFTAPHTPLQAPDEYLEKFAHLAVEGEAGVNCGYRPGFVVDHPRQVYAAMVAAMDDTIGRVLEALRATGAEDNTVVWFLSDNGAPSLFTDIGGVHRRYSPGDNGPLRGFKGDLLEGGVRVPFAMQWKQKIPAAQTMETPVTSLDILPTSLAAASIARPSGLDGVNLLPLMLEGQDLPERALFWKFPFPPHFHVFGIRAGDWKLVSEACRKENERGFDRLRGGKTGLYNLSRDLREERDLSESDNELRTRLQGQFDEWAANLPALPDLDD